MPDRPYVIALEEHFQDPELGALYGPLDANAAAQDPAGAELET
jgi:hypothetical protein